MDSKIFDYKDYRIGVTAPPFHPNCRSDTVPYFGDEFEKEIDQGIGRMARDPKTGKSEPVENLFYEDWYKKYVYGETKNYNTQKKESINFFDSIEEWKEVSKDEAKTVEGLQIWKHEGKEYKVDGKYVVLDYSKHEKEVAMVIAQKYGKEVRMVPKVNFPLNISTPDYIIEGEKWDLKTLTEKATNNTIFNRVQKSKRQADNFIIDISSANLSETILISQVKKIFNVKSTENVKKIIIFKHMDILHVYEKK